MEGSEGTGNDLIQVSPLHFQALVYTKNALLPKTPKPLPCCISLNSKTLAMLHTQQALLHQLQNRRLPCHDEIINRACSTLQTSDLVYTLPYIRRFLHVHSAAYMLQM